MNTLFKSQVSRKSSGWNREEKIPKTVEIKAIGHGKSQPAGMRVRLMLLPGHSEEPQYFAVRQPFLHGKLKEKCQVQVTSDIANVFLMQWCIPLMS